MNKKNKQKGITLIALIITIIVMLILVAVTITVAVNGGLFGYAERAATKTNEAIRKEQDLASGDIIDYYLNRKQAVVALDEYKEDLLNDAINKSGVYKPTNLPQNDHKKSTTKPQNVLSKAAINPQTPKTNAG